MTVIDIDVILIKIYKQKYDCNYEKIIIRQSCSDFVIIEKHIVILAMFVRQKRKITLYTSEVK